MVMKNADNNPDAQAEVQAAEARAQEDAAREERARRNLPGAGAEIDTSTDPVAGAERASMVAALRVRLDRLKHYAPTTARYEFNQIADDLERMLKAFVRPGSGTVAGAISYGRLSVGETVTDENADAERGEREKAELNAKDAADRKARADADARERNERATRENRELAENRKAQERQPGYEAPTQYPADTPPGTVPPGTI